MTSVGKSHQGVPSLLGYGKEKKKWEGDVLDLEHRLPPRLPLPPWRETGPPCHLDEKVDSNR